MKLIIAGSRNLEVTSRFIDSVLFQFDYPYIYSKSSDEIVSGGEIGIDSCGEIFAESMGIKLTRFPASVRNHGRAAGPIRNQEMADYADGLLLIWDGTSRGSLDMKTRMIALKKPIYEVILKKTN